MATPLQRSPHMGSPSVQRQSSTGTIDAGHVDSLEGGAPPPSNEKTAGSAATNALVSHPDAAREDSTQERELRTEFKALEPGASYEMDAAMEGEFGLNGAAKGKVKVERQEDGTYVVDIEQSLAMGVGAHAKGKVGLGGNERFHVRTAAEAADFVDALLKFQVTGDSKTLKTIGTFFPNSYSSAAERVQSYYANKVETRLDVSLGLKLGEKELKKASFGDLNIPGEMKAQLEAKASVAWDREQSALKTTSSFTLSAEAAAKLGFLGDKAELGGTARVILTRTFTPTPADLKAVERGEISMATAIARGRSTLRVELEVEGEAKAGSSLPTAGGAAPKAAETLVRLRGDFEVESPRGMTLDALASGFKEAEWKVDFEAAVGDRRALDFDVVKAHVATMRRAKTTVESHSRREAVDLFKAASAADDDLTALRATANVR